MTEGVPQKRAAPTIRNLSVTLRDVSVTLPPPPTTGDGSSRGMEPVRLASRRCGGTGSAPADRHPARRVRLAPDALLLSASIGLVAVLVKVAWPRFTWFGDNAESFFPLWHMVGAALREGRWLGFDPNGWAGANIVGESAYGMFNPVTLLNALVISGFDELGRAAFLVMTEFLVLLGLGVRALALAYGARRAAAFTVGLIVPFGGFTLYWGAGNWASGLMALTWLVWAWWAARRYVTGARGPLPFVLCAGLAVTVGSPYSLLGVLVVLCGMAVELARARQFRRLQGLVVAGLCVGGIAVLAYLPLIHAMPVGHRGTTASVSNSSYLSPSLGDLLGLSSPTMIPEINAWEGRTDKVPSIYLSWLILPLLPWVRWRPAGAWRTRAGLLLPTAVFGLMTLGPDQIWMFRWPLRLIEYSWVGLAVCFAILLSAGPARDHVRRRAYATALVIGGGFFLAWSSTPKDGLAHLAWTAVVGGLVAGTLVAVRRRGLRALPVMAVVGTLIITPAQAAVHGWDHQSVTHDMDLGRVSDLESVREASATYRGTVYQLSNVQTLTNPGATLSGKLTFGNIQAAAGYDTVNRYTGIGYTDFMLGLSLDYHGSLMESSMVRRMWQQVPGYQARVVDVVGVDTVVLGRGQFPAKAYRSPADWHTVLQDDVRQVLQRRDVPAPGPTVTPSRGVDVVAAADEGSGVRIAANSRDGGTVLVDQLNWPGYTATTGDGRAVEVREGPLGLVEIVVPPGSTVVHLDYDVPGLRTGLVALTLSLLVALAHQLLWRRRRTAPSGPRIPTAPAPRTPATAPRTARTASVPPTPSARVTLPSQKSVSAPPRAEPERATT